MDGVGYGFLTDDALTHIPMRQLVLAMSFLHSSDTQSSGNDRACDVKPFLCTG